MFKSSRFIAFVVAVILFTVMVYTTEYDPMAIAGAISVIAGIYIVPRTYRGAQKE
jgi:hypothetical protein